MYFINISAHCIEHFLFVFTIVSFHHTSNIFPRIFLNQLSTYHNFDSFNQRCPDIVDPFEMVWFPYVSHLSWWPYRTPNIRQCETQMRI